jgi:hypothetical protein
MTFTDLCAAIWDRREITLTTDDGRELTCIPGGVSHARWGKTDGRFVLSYEQDGGRTRGTTFIRFDSFDGHSQEPTP